MTTDFDFLEHIDPKYEIGEQRPFKPPLPKCFDQAVEVFGENSVRRELAELAKDPAPPRVHLWQIDDSEGGWVECGRCGDKSQVSFTSRPVHCPGVDR